MILTETVLATFKDASKKLTGHCKRDFMAKVTEDYFDGSARKAQTVMGWNRQSVQLGLNERRAGIICVDNYQARGRHKSEQVLPNLQDFLSWPYYFICHNRGNYEDQSIFVRLSHSNRFVASPQLMPEALCSLTQVL